MKPGASALIAFFIASLLASTYLGSKLVDVFGITVSIGLFIFPFTFVALEVAAEIYGKKFAASIIRIGLAVQIFTLALIVVGGWLPASSARDLGNSYEIMFGLAPRMILASVAAYFFSEFVDLSVFLRVREATEGRHLWLRANLALLLSQAVDTVLFMVLFLGGVIPLASLWKSTIAAYLVKVVVGAVDTPLVYLGVKAARYLDEKSRHSAPLTVVGIRTQTFKVGEVLTDFVGSEIERHFDKDTGYPVPEGLIIAVTSKIVSLAEGRVRAKGVPVSATREEQLLEKHRLIQDETKTPPDRFLGETLFGVALTIKDGILIPSAGIDESNSESGGYILFPENPYASAERLGRGLRERFGLRRLGVVITDSHTQPLRKGVTGIGLSHWGFRATKNYVGRKDLFGREIKMTHVNVLDALSVAAVYAMGETDERKPIAVIENSGAEFTDATSFEEIRISAEEDLYGHLLFPPA